MGSEARLAGSEVSVSPAGIQVISDGAHCNSTQEAAAESFDQSLLWQLWQAES